MSEPEQSGLKWTSEALERLERIPSFVRPMAKMGIESFAKDNGHTEITGEVMDAARGNFPTQF
ncbi:protochlorophyllide oxidoreductase [Candidatus Poribacteria bacterium]|nr:protochlorophyllide oxidoreductase [Candidatus Poribacteria bacterium]